MNLRQHMRFLTFISVVSASLILIVISFTSNIGLAVVIGLVADIVQIVTYGVWLFQKEVHMAEVPKQVKEVHTIITKEREESKVTGEIVSRLIREGVVSEADLLPLIRGKEIFLAFPYAEGLAGKVWQITKGQPLAKLLSQIGFVRVTLNQNLMVIVADSLPKQLQDIDRLNNFIKRNLPTEWSRISDKVKELYPAEKYKVKYEKWRSRAGFKVSYILARSMAQDFLISYLTKYSFSNEFRKHIAGRIDRKQLKKMLKLRKREVKEIVSRISIEILLGDMPRNVQQLIIKEEDKVKKVLGVKIITDYRLLEPQNVTNVLTNLFPSIEEELIRSYSSKIISESQKCYESLRKWGIDLR